MNIDKDYTPCNTSDRDGYDITLVVVHHTSSPNINGTISWFKNPKAQASAHYVIGLDGKIVAMVPEEKKAWHAGRSSFKNQDDGANGVNKFSIGIELVGDGNQTAYTTAQYDSLIWLCKEIKARYSIADDCFTGHEFIAPGRKNDPGSLFDWKRFMRGVCDDQPPSFVTTPEEPDAAGYRALIKEIALQQA